MHWLREITEAKLGQVLSSGAMAKLSKAMGNKMGKLSGKKKFSGIKKDRSIILFWLRKNSIRKEVKSRNKNLPRAKALEAN